MNLRRSLLSLAFACAFVVPAQAGTSVYFSPNGGGADAVAAKIKSAKYTIDVAMYSISTSESQAIFSSLKEAIQQRNVRVRVILNKATSSNKSKAAALKAIGAHVFYTTATLHEKFSIIDAQSWSGRTLTNGSANWSSKADTVYSENTVIFDGWRNHALIHQFQEEFNTLLSVARTFNPDGEADPVADQHRDPVTFSVWAKNGSMKGLFTSANVGSGPASGEGVVNRRIVEALRSAQRSIVIDIAHFDSAPIADALIARVRAARQAGTPLDVQVLLEQGELGPGGQARRIEREGIDVRYKYYSQTYTHPQSQLMHHKTAIVDGELMITGSYNYSKTAEFKNYENVIVVDRRNQSLIDAFVGEHDRLWEGGRGQYRAFLSALRAQPGDANYQRYVPVHFNTPYFQGYMTLTRWEVDPIYRGFGSNYSFTKKRSAKIWDRETDQEYRRQNGESQEQFMNRLIAENGTFLQPKTAAVAPVAPVQPVAPGVGLNGSLPGQQ